MLKRIQKYLAAFRKRSRTERSWQGRTLVVGPCQPVDGDSVSCVKALIKHLRSRGLEAYTLPTQVMYRQLDWILTDGDFFAGADSLTIERTTISLQLAFDTLIASWRPDEIVLVDGPRRQLGFDPRGIPVYTIDHHISGGVTRDDDEAYIQPAPSAGCLLISRFGILDPILAVSILTDTFWFRQNLPGQAAGYLAELVKAGLTDEALIDLQRKLFVRKDPQIVVTLNRSDLRIVGDSALCVLPTADAELHRGVMGELGYFCANLCVVRADGYVSMKVSDPKLDLRPLATKYGGGGHPNMAAGHLKEVDNSVTDELFREFVETVSGQ